MRDWVEKLLILQDKDLRISKLEGQVSAAPEEKARLASLLVAAQDASQNAKVALQDEGKALKTLELESEAVVVKMQDFQSKSAMIKSNDDYRAAMTQIDKCKKKIAGIEDRELLVMEDVEAAGNVLQQKQKELDAAQARVREMAADLDTRVKNCNIQLEKLRQQRALAIAEVKPEVASRYERMQQSNKKKMRELRVFVPLHDNICDYCHMNVTAQIRMNARKGEAICCENCGAMLYWAED